jgi:phage/plasmid-like protein (TIGR03299 family)
MAEKLVPVNNGFGSWEPILFGSFTEIGQRCLNMADHVGLDEALKRGGADFGVGMVPVSYSADGYPLLQVAGQNVTYRQDTGEALGVVGNGYTVVQTRMAMGVADSIDAATGGEGNFIGCATVDNGRQIAAIYALPALTIGTDEEVLPLLIIWTSHDGSRAVEIRFLPMRVACWNGNMWHVEGTSSVVRVKHTRTAEARLSVASDALAVGNAFFTEWARQAKVAAAAKIDITQADAYLAQIVVDREKGQKADTIREKTIAAIRAKYLHTPDLQNLVGTKYGLLQATSDYVDHDLRTRVVDKDDGMTAEARDSQLRFLRATSHHYLKDNAARILLAA